MNDTDTLSNTENDKNSSVLGRLSKLDAAIYEIHTQEPERVQRLSGSVVDEIDLSDLLSNNLTTSSNHSSILESFASFSSSSSSSANASTSSSNVPNASLSSSLATNTSSSLSSKSLPLPSTWNSSNWPSLLDRNDDRLVLQHCHIVSMIPFTPTPTLSVYEDAAAIALALQHLNAGDGSVVPQLQGLDQRCPIRFTVEFLDTQGTPGLAIDDVFEIASRVPFDHVENNKNDNAESNGDIDINSDDNNDQGTSSFSSLLPCAFWGAERSSVAMPTGLLTGHRGYVQVSPSASATALDDKLLYPLFGRTVQSDKHTAKLIFDYLRDVIGIRHLVMMNVNEAFGNSFGQALQVCVEQWNLEQVLQGRKDQFRFFRVSLSVDLRDLDGALERIKESQYRYILAAVHGRDNEVVLERAVERGMAGDGLHQWLFPSSFESLLDDVTFRKGSPLHLAFRGTGVFAPASTTQSTKDLLGLSDLDFDASFGVDDEDDSNNNDVASIYRAFAEQMAAVNNPVDINYIRSIIPRGPSVGSTPSRGSITTKQLPSVNVTSVSLTPTLSDRLQNSFVHRFENPTQSDDSSHPFLEEESFLRPVRFDSAAFAYDATVLLGLAACEATGNSGITFNGEAHFWHLRRQSYTGVTGNVQLELETGSRSPNSTYHKLFNFLEEEFEEIQPNNETISMIRFRRVLTDVYFNSTWHSMTPFTFSNNSTNSPSDLPQPGNSVSNISPAVRGISLSFWGISTCTAIALAVWTFLNRKKRVVRASQPFFLYLICFGAIIVASATIPMTFDLTVASLEANSKACNATVWLMSLGISIIFAALFTKTWRINKIMRNAQQFRRVKVTIKDTVMPMIALLVCDIAILTAMTVIRPVQYAVSVTHFDVFDRPVSFSGRCEFNPQRAYIFPLVGLNLFILFLSIYQAYRARDLSTEFTESKSIFKALQSIVVTTFVGAPVLVLASDQPDAVTFLFSAINFVVCMNVLLMIFLPKIIFCVREKNRRSSVTVTGIGELSSTALTGGVTGLSPYRVSAGGTGMPPRVSSEHSQEDDGRDGERILTTKTATELAAMVKKLEKLLWLQHQEKERGQRNAPVESTTMVLDSAAPRDSMSVWVKNADETAALVSTPPIGVDEETPSKEESGCEGEGEASTAQSEETATMVVDP